MIEMIMNERFLFPDHSYSIWSKLLLLHSIFSFVVCAGISALTICVQQTVRGTWQAERGRDTRQVASCMWGDERRVEKANGRQEMASCTWQTTGNGKLHVANGRKW
jgi:hypothetical protein